MKKPITTFIRTLKAKCGDKEVSIITQPYCVGLYVSVSDSRIGHQQCALAWSSVKKWFKIVIGKLESDGFDIEVDEQPLNQYLQKYKIDEYVNG